MCSFKHDVTFCSSYMYYFAEVLEISKMCTYIIWLYIAEASMIFRKFFQTDTHLIKHIFKR